MRFNALAASLSGAFTITNLYTNTVLDLSGSDQVTSTLTVSEIARWFDALTQFLDGLLMEDKINKCVEILLLVIRSNDLIVYSGLLRSTALTSPSRTWPTPTNMSVTMVRYNRRRQVRMSSV